MQHAGKEGSTQSEGKIVHADREASRGVKSLGISKVAVSWGQPTCQLVQGKKIFQELLKEGRNCKSLLLRS